ncbi:flagellar protein [Planococcus maritimus]|uniref:flagellar protein n=1 Tax=Planococcus maritimus TaxID=192421 RepID=UPI003139A943
MIYLTTPKLDNCPSCGELFLRDQIACCLKCHQENEKAFKRVYLFLQEHEHRNASLEDVHLFTGVSVHKISEFLREGRILTGDYPNLGYPCAHCKTLIHRHMLCEDCRLDFLRSANEILADDDEWANSTQARWKMKK